MLQLIIDGKTAALPTDVELGLTLNNYILVERKEDATYPFTLSLKANRHIFGFPERLQYNSFNRELPALVKFGPYTLLTGRAVVTDIDENDIELFVATKTTSFWGINAGLYLDELDLGRERYDNAAALQNHLDTSLHNYLPYVCVELYDYNYDSPYYIPNFYNKWDFVEQRLMRTWGVHYNSFSPFMRLIEAIEMVITACGYAIRTNDLRKIEGFEDILIIKRTNLGKDNNMLIFADLLPHITLKDFFDEIERKFSVRLFVNEAAKEVSLRSAVLIRTATYMPVSALDGVKKTFQKDEEENAGPRNYKFYDKEVADPNVQRYKSYLTVLIGEDEDTVNTECISTIVASHSWADVIDPAGHEVEGDYETNVYVDYEQLEINTATPETPEFRLAVYRGIHNRATDGPNKEFYGNVPIATPDPVADAANKISLLWTGDDGLYKKFHEERIKGMEFAWGHELLVVPDVKILSRTQELFTDNIVVRNQRYVVESQEITLKKDEIVEHKLTAYPV